MDAKELFGARLPGVMQASPDKARELDAIYVFKINGDGGGTWTLDLKSDPPTCSEGDAGNAECTIEASSEDFNAMLKDPQLGMQLFFQGKLKVDGNPMLATKLQQLLSLA